MYFHCDIYVYKCYKLILFSITMHLRLKSCEEAHFFLSSADKFCCFLIDLLHPAVIVPNLVNALRIIGELGTLLALCHIVSDNRGTNIV